jgi:hypothetical protein
MPHTCLSQYPSGSAQLGVIDSGVHGFIFTAQAVVGRPLTPMSAAGRRAKDRARLCSGRLLLGPFTADDE